MAFGEGTDWNRNIAASGTATIRRHGVEHEVGDPTTVDPDSGVLPFPRWERSLLHALGIRRFLLLKER